MQERCSKIDIDLPKNMLIAGSTQSGKTHFVKRLLLESERVFKPRIDRIIYSYGAWQPIFDELLAHFGDMIEFRTDIPSKEELTKLWQEQGGETLLVLDDKMGSLKDNAKGAEILEIICVISHHCHVSVMLTLQNIFHNKIVQEISLNTHYICLFRNNRSARQVATLATQVMPSKTPYFIDSYEKATAKNYGYLFIDLSPGRNNKYTLRSCIFPDEDPIIYLPKN